jgi:hypothetical protein
VEVPDGAQLPTLNTAAVMIPEDIGMIYGYTGLP